MGTRDWPVRCVQSSSQNISEMSADTEVEALKAAIKEAERDVDLAERALKNKQLKLKAVQKQLQDAIIAGVGGLKISGEQDQQVKKPEPPKDEATRRAEVRKKWRILGMKIKFGLGAQALAVKKRNLKDADSFIDKGSEEENGQETLQTRRNQCWKYSRQRWFLENQVKHLFSPKLKRKLVLLSLPIKGYNSLSLFYKWKTIYIFNKI